MIRTNLVNQAEEILNSYKVENYKDKKRFDNMNVYLEKYLGGSGNDGFLGDIIELSSHSSGSEIYTVRKQGQHDFYITVDDKHYSCECKSRGGDITSIINGTCTSKYIRAYLDFDKKPNKAGVVVHRHIDVVLLTSDYKAIMESTNAYREQTNRNRPGIVEFHQQADSEKLYKALKDYPPFARNFNYIDEDFK